MAKKELDTATLIDICARGVVRVEDWRNRDSPSAQQQLAWAGALLKAGCPWVLANDMDDKGDTIWIRITHPTFGTFDWGEEEDDELFYLPSEKRLTDNAGSDWY